MRCSIRVQQFWGGWDCSVGSDVNKDCLCKDKDQAFKDQDKD